MLENTKPIIGIVSKHLLKEEIRPNMYIRDEMKQAIFDNGAVAIGILLPKDEKINVSDDWKNNLNEQEYDNLIAQIKIPVLGICCGQNVMVRALGGTTKLVSNPEKHNDKMSFYVHDVNVCKDSRFYEIIKEERMLVNSRHKKTIETHPRLKVNCMCDDGYIDGVEDPNKLFYMAFRFHSESLYKNDENHNKIFKEFIKVCKEVKGVKYEINR